MSIKKELPISEALFNGLPSTLTVQLLRLIDLRLFGGLLAEFTPAEAKSRNTEKSHRAWFWNSGDSEDWGQVRSAEFRGYRLAKVQPCSARASTYEAPVTAETIVYQSKLDLYLQREYQHQSRSPAVKQG